MARRRLEMGLTTRSSQGNTHTSRDSTPRSTSRLTPVSENVALLEPRSVGNGNSPDDRTTNSDVVVFHSDVRRLLREQKRLQETSSRIQTMLVDMQKDAATSSASQKCQVPRDLSATVRDVYSQLQGEDDDLTWDFSVSFDDSKNQAFNKAMIRNVQTAYANENHVETSVVLIKKAVRTYFKTKKSCFGRRS